MTDNLQRDIGRSTRSLAECMQSMEDPRYRPSEGGNCHKRVCVSLRALGRGSGDHRIYEACTIANAFATHR